MDKTATIAETKPSIHKMPTNKTPAPQPNNVLIPNPPPNPPPNKQHINLPNLHIKHIILRYVSYEYIKLTISSE